MNISVPLFASCICKVPDEITNNLLSKSFYKNYKQKNKTQPTYSSFQNHPKSEKEVIFHNSLYQFYSPIIDSFMMSIGHYHNFVYNWELWWQIYEPNSPGFVTHRHAEAGNFQSVISFNHFVKTIPDKSFFTWVFGNELEILHEEVEDEIIFFPSTSFHKVLPNDTDQFRVTVSGNIFNVVGENYCKSGNYP